MKDNPVSAALKLQQSQSLRGLEMAECATRLAAHKPDPVVWVEGMALAEAAAMQAMQLQQGWVRAWGDWFVYANTLQGVDTIPKLVERSNNIVLQAGATALNQAQQASELMDNIAVSTAFWLRQQTKDD
jgi:hypothetical protein